MFRSTIMTLYENIGSPDPLPAPQQKKFEKTPKDPEEKLIVILNRVFCDT